MTMINMQDGSEAMEHELVSVASAFIAQELEHWRDCMTCSASTTVDAEIHRAARLAKPLMSS